MNEANRLELVSVKRKNLYSVVVSTIKGKKIVLAVIVVTFHIGDGVLNKASPVFIRISMIVIMSSLRRAPQEGFALFSLGMVVVTFLARRGAVPKAEFRWVGGRSVECQTCFAWRSGAIFGHMHPRRAVRSSTVVTGV